MDIPWRVNILVAVVLLPLAIACLLSAAIGDGGWFSWLGFAADAVIGVAHLVMGISKYRAEKGGG